MDNTRDSQEFIAFACETGVLRFGEFELKSGRISPYFFNAGLFNDGASLARLADFYARTIIASGLSFDMLFGPAYKGIALAAATAMALAARGRNIPFAFNRKEAKDHGEGGSLIGAPLAGRVLIVDDVISAGVSVRAAAAAIVAAGAVTAGLIVAVDRQEKGEGDLSAVQEVESGLGVPVMSVGKLDDVISYLQEQPDFGRQLQSVRRYREKYGVA